ncbi:MAG: cupin domain-containing protein [Deltaproteobacteria bacterium]
MTTEVSVDRWGEAEPPTALELEKRLRAEGFQPYRYSDPPGTRYPPHRHGAHEVRWLLCGRLRFRFSGDREIVLAAGDRLDLPPGVEHAVAVEGDDPAVCVAVGGDAQLH